MARKPLGDKSDTRRKASVRDVFLLAGQLAVLVMALRTFVLRRDSAPVDGESVTEPTASVTSGGWHPRRRLARAASVMAGIASVSMVVAGTTFAVYSAQSVSSKSTFTSGTVVGTGTSVQSCSSAGVFPNGIQPGSSSVLTELNLSGGTTITNSTTSATVLGLAKTISSGDTLLIGQGTSTPAPIQVTASGSSNTAGATTLNFTYTGSSASFPQGTLVADLSSQNSGALQAPCTFTYTYGGSGNQYLAADVLIVSGGSSNPKLWDPTTTGLELVMTDSNTPRNVFTLPTSAAANCTSAIPGVLGTVSSGGQVCGLATNDVLFTTPSTGVNTGTFTLTLDWGLPTTAPSADQNGTTTVYVLFHAVQAPNNSISCTSTPTSPGQPCVPSGTFSWS